MPDETPKSSYWAFAAYQECCDQTGGDYYDFVVNEQQQSIDGIVGDVSGHGIGAALMMSTARAFLLGLYERNDNLEQLLGDLNRLLERDMADDTFMTMCIARANQDGSLNYASAGHDPPFVYRHNTKTFDDLDSTGLLLGATDEFDYDIEDVTAVEKGDIFVVVTDGIFEAHHKDSGEEWGMKRLKHCIAQHSQSDAQEICDAMVAEVRAFVGGKQTADDFTVVVGKRL